MGNDVEEEREKEDKETAAAAASAESICVGHGTYRRRAPPLPQPRKVNGASPPPPFSRPSV